MARFERTQCDAHNQGLSLARIPIPPHPRTWSPGRDSNSQNSMFKTDMYSDSITRGSGAGNRDRTDDIGLGRTALCQLSYTRKRNW